MQYKSTFICYPRGDRGALLVRHNARRVRSVASRCSLSIPEQGRDPTPRYIRHLYHTSMVLLRSRDGDRPYGRMYTTCAGVMDRFKLTVSHTGATDSPKNAVKDSVNIQEGCAVLLYDLRFAT